MYVTFVLALLTVALMFEISNPETCVHNSSVLDGLLGSLSHTAMPYELLGSAPNNGSESHQITKRNRQIGSGGLNLKQECIAPADASTSVCAVGVIYRCSYVLMRAHNLCF